LNLVREHDHIVCVPEESLLGEGKGARLRVGRGSIAWNWERVVDANLRAFIQTTSTLRGLFLLLSCVETFRKLWT